LNWELRPLANKDWVPPEASLGVHLGFVGTRILGRILIYQLQLFGTSPVTGRGAARQPSIRMQQQARRSRQTRGSCGVAHHLACTPCACRQGVVIRDLDMKKSSSRVAYVWGPSARASQRVLIVELISAHASTTPARNMPAAPFISVCNCYSCGLSKKGSGAKSVVVDAQGASKARTATVDVYSLVPGLGALRFSLAAQQTAFFLPFSKFFII